MQKSEENPNIILNKNCPQITREESKRRRKEQIKIRKTA